jgi:uncharacterized repeat protein (TIGR03803 family)
MTRLQIAAYAITAVLAGGSAQSTTFTTLYTFTGGADGGYPQYARLAVDANGVLYGAAPFGGNVDCPLVSYPGPGCGVVYKLDPSSNRETVLYTFTDGADGAQPWGGVTLDRAGNLYGTAVFGGAHGQGVFFKLDQYGNQTVLYAFQGSVGANPSGDLITDASGNIYGTAVTGGHLEYCSGSGCGVAFKWSEASGLAVHRFATLANPTHALIQDAIGNSYGATENGGSSLCYNSEPFEAVETYVGGCGSVFVLDGTGKISGLYDFGPPPDGSDPRSSLIRDTEGNSYGTTFYGGLYGYGIVFRVSPTGHETVLYNFQGASDGANPWGGLARDTEGNLYGTTNHAGGSCYCGTVFKLAPGGNYTVLHTFSGSDGQYPEAPLLLYNGALYGTSSGGGTTSIGGEDLKSGQVTGGGGIDTKSPRLAGLPRCR